MEAVFLFLGLTVMTMSKFKSIKKENVSSLYKEKGSKFIGLLGYCTTEEEAMTHIQEWREKHPQAVHVCYAYQLGVNKDKYRYNDDGEPSNSAGAPIFGQIQSFDITNVVIGIVRYYGGVNLGVGGLINAYRTAAKEVIELAEVVDRELEKKLKLQFDYSEMAVFMNEVKKQNLKITKQHFEQECYIEIIIKLSNLDAIEYLSNKFDTLKTTEI